VVKLEGKVAIVTGAASGIGRATALLFAAEGAAVVVADVNNGGGMQTVEAIRSAGGRAQYVHTDVSRSPDVQAMVRAAVERFGRLDVLFNNAGIAVFKGVEETTEDEWDRVVAVNLRGVYLGIKYAAPEMRRAGGGSIINTSSVHGMQTVAGLAAYAASKHGVLGITRAAALDLARSGIRVNAIQPGAIETPIMRANLRAVGDEEEEYRKIAAAEPLGRVGTAEEIARAAVFLASDDASFITGAPIAVDGGLLAQLLA
jgi:NAD(P)-dependent dehydrogenase (short-subunit alcohol dehydrogenase family)